MTDEFAKEVIKINLRDELRKSYLDYAMSVIIGRALPDLRDGMKPVHRRILYAMHVLSNSWNRPYKKSARVVGDVIGKYHPHGDNSVYDALVRMAQDFSMRYPLVDGQGNFGSVDGDSPAAMRYTEVRMSRIAHLMLAGLDQDTVDMQDNYDGNETMPEVLPGLLPNLLVNGSSGIAVGMTTTIPTHNLTEVCNACLALLDEPELSIEQLMEHVTGPDFPTGGFIMGRAGIVDAFRTGRGKIYIRSRSEIVENNGRESIIVTEIPFQVNKARMIERIALLVRDKKLQGIAEIRDESDKDGLRVVIDIKRNEMASVVLKNLWLNSQLEISFSINMVVLDRGRPKLMNLRQLLAGYLDHRRTVIIRRTRFELAKARLRGHILEGLAIALANLDSVIAAIRQSMDQPEAMEKLMGTDWKVNDVAAMLERAGADACRPADIEEDYGVRTPEKFAKGGMINALYRLSLRQAKAILELRLHRLTGMEQKELHTEYGEMLEKIGELDSILQDADKLRSVIREEITEMRDQFGDGRRTEIRAERGNLTNADLITPENRILTISRLGYTKGQPVSEYHTQRRGGVGKTATSVKEGDVVEHMLVANTHDPIMFFTNRGKVYRLPLYEIPVAARGARGRPINNLLPLQDGEKISSVLAVGQVGGHSHIFMATALGRVKRTPLEDFQRVQRQGKIALRLVKGDELIGTSLSAGKDSIMLATAHGQVIRFIEDEVRSTGRSAQGVRGIRLAKSERVIALIVPDEESQLVFISSGGYGKRIRMSKFRLQHRGGKGLIGMKLSIGEKPKGGKGGRAKRHDPGEVVAVRRLDGNEDLVLINDKGVLLRTAAKNVRMIGRIARGVRIQRSKEGAQSLLVDAVVVESDDKAERAAGNGAKAGTTGKTVKTVKASKSTEKKGSGRKTKT